MDKQRIMERNIAEARERMLPRFLADPQPKGRARGPIKAIEPRVPRKLTARVPGLKYKDGIETMQRLSPGNYVSRDGLYEIKEEDVARWVVYLAGHMKHVGDATGYTEARKVVMRHRKEVSP